MDHEEEGLKAKIRELFQLVKPEHRQQVIDKLKPLTNDQRVSFLRGWTKVR